MGNVFGSQKTKVEILEPIEQVDIFKLIETHNKWVNDNLEKIKKWIKENKDNLEIKNKYENTPLHCASLRGHSDVAKVLIEAGADIENKGENGETPLHSASFTGDSDTVKLLIKKGANINAISESRFTSLLWSLINVHIDVLKVLIEKGADLSIQGIWGDTHLQTIFRRTSWKPLFINIVNNFIINDGPLKTLGVIHDDDIEEFFSQENSEITPLDQFLLKDDCTIEDYQKLMNYLAETAIRDSGTCNKNELKQALKEILNFCCFKDTNSKEVISSIENLNHHVVNILLDYQDCDLEKLAERIVAQDMIPHFNIMCKEINKEGDKSPKFDRLVGLVEALKVPKNIEYGSEGLEKKLKIVCD